MPILEMRTTPRRWKEIANNINVAGAFSLYSSIFSTLDIDYNIAWARMLQLYENEVTTYTNDYIPLIFANNFYANQKKYAELIALYEEDIDIFSPVNMTESYTDTRTPNLTSASTSSAGGSTETKNNQSRTSTTTPATTITTNHSVNPFDNSGLRQETQDTSTDSGTNTTVESYSGLADKIESTSSSSSSVSTTGTETIVHSLTRSGRDGKFTISDLINQAEEAAKELNLLDLILNDIAEQVFLQVWL